MKSFIDHFQNFILKIPVFMIKMILRKILQNKVTNFRNCYITFSKDKDIGCIIYFLNQHVGQFLVI